MIANNQKAILERIAYDSGVIPTQSSPLTGGDINEVYLLETQEDKFVIKLNHANKFPGMFEAEKLGLEKLKEPGIIDVPNPIKTGTIDSQAYLILEHKSSAAKASDFWELFGEQLAKLHQQTSESFGLASDNYIGSLPQFNDNRDSAAKFYIEMRLEPQIKMAEEKGYKLNVSEKFYSNCRELIPDEPPALIHGDLWNGNYLVNDKGHPCLIDPAVAYAPREMDLGMMKLFGGFNESLFQVYHETYPLEKGWENRIALWQLYYLLVHLNIFGAGYKSQVTSIIKKYS